MGRSNEGAKGRDGEKGRFSSGIRIAVLDFRVDVDQVYNLGLAHTRLSESSVTRILSEMMLGGWGSLGGGLALMKHGAQAVHGAGMKLGDARLADA